MAKLKLEMPKEYGFRTVLPIRITDLNYGGHLGNDAVLTLVHEARVRFLKELGGSELDVGGVGLIMANAQIIFAAQGHYGMELEIAVGVTDIGTLGFDLCYLLTDCLSGQEIARVLTTQVCFDYQRKRPVRLPEKFRADLESRVRP